MPPAHPRRHLVHDLRIRRPGTGPALYARPRHELIERELSVEALPLGTFGDLGTEELLIAKTADRSVLGCMNDMAYLCEDTVARARKPGAARTFASLNRRLRRNINSARDYQRPIDLVLERTPDNHGRGQRNARRTRLFGTPQA